MKMRTYHLEAILQFLENAVQDGDTKISIGEDQFIPVSILRETHDEIDNIDRTIEYLYRSNVSLKVAMNDIGVPWWKTDDSDIAEVWERSMTEEKFEEIRKGWQLINEHN